MFFRAFNHGYSKYGNHINNQISNHNTNHNKKRSSFYLFLCLLILSLPAVSFAQNSGNDRLGNMNQVNQVNQQAELVLNDIHQPEPISDFPVAIGWWILLLLIVSLIVFLIGKIIKHKHLNKDKKAALKLLNENKYSHIEEVLVVVKWVAMQYYNRNEIAKLHGESFQKFLLAGLQEQYKSTFKQLTDAAFSKQYQPCSQNQEKANTLDLDNFKAGVILWVNHTLPLKGPMNNLINMKESLSSGK
jgi:hypothetical protein